MAQHMAAPARAAVLCTVLSLAGCGGNDSEPPGTESGFVDVGGAELYYEARGAGTPVVLVHGFTLDTRLWDPQVAAFAERHRVIRYDARGFGRSSEISEPYSTSDDLRAVLDFLGVDQAAVVGISMGGRYVTDFALAYPERVTALVAADPGLSGQPLPTIAAEIMPVLEAARSGDLAEAKRRWFGVSIFGPAREQPEVEARLQAMVDEYSGWHFVNGLGAQETPLSPPAAERLASIAVPTLALIGERDIADEHVIVDRLAAEIPGAREEVLPGVGHFTNLEAPETFNRLVLDFLDLVP